MFIVNESSTAGMLLALQDAGLAGKVKLVGFDANQAFVDAMHKGELQGFVLQNPFKMSSLAVTTLVDHLQGKTVPKLIDTGVSIVTPANVDAPEMQALIKPPLDQYLAPGE
jgi:ribose transport system substrate-binding protein